MEKTRTLKTVGMFVLVLLLAFCFIAGCQSSTSSSKPTDDQGAKTSVDITQETPVATESPAASPTPKQKPITGKYKRKTSRDPFVPPYVIAGLQVTGNNTLITPPVSKDDGSKNKSSRSTVAKIARGAFVYPGSSLGLELKGTMKVGGTYMAMIAQSGTKKAYNVAVGEKIGDYSVASVSKNRAVLKARNKSGQLIIVNLRMNSGVGAKVPKGIKKGTDSGPRLPDSLPPPPPQ